ncbi:unnamed protein product, partial [Didymodactylos carnosus]
MSQQIPFVNQYANESMKNAVDDAVKSGDTTDLTVSGDGSWQKRGFSSVHGVSTINSSNTLLSVPNGRAVGCFLNSSSREIDNEVRFSALERGHFKTSFHKR